MKVTKKRYLFLTYTILFAILCMIVFYPFFTNHLSLIWGRSGEDGTSQHLASLIYYGDYIRTFFSNLIHGNFQFPMWNNSIGFGSDILTTLNYYAIGDPLNIVYVFANKANASYLYTFMTLFRAYLVGISFIIFGCYFKKNPYGILIGSFTYIFSGVFLNYAIRHPFFLNPMIYLPLLIVGVEKIYRKEKPYLFTIMVAISAMSNFYFFYMLTAVAVIYALIRFPVYKEAGFFKTLGRFAGWYILGLGLSMILLLPVIIAFMGNARSSSGVNYFSIFLYQRKYYQSLILQSIGFHLPGRGTSLNFIALAYCGGIVLLLKKSKERFPYKASLILGVVFTLFPIFAYVLHAFSYPMNRWHFAFAFIIGAVLMEVYEDLLNLTLLQKIGIVLGIIFYYMAYKRYAEGALDVKYAAIILILTAVVLFVVNEIPFMSKFHLNHLLLLGLTCFSVSFAGFGHYSTRLSTVIDSYVSFDEAYDLLGEQEDSLFRSANIKVNQLDRVDAMNEPIPNWGIIRNIPTTSNYYSITDKNVSDSLENLGLNQYQYKFKFKKLDMREGLLNLYHTKYIIINKLNGAKIPNGYKLIKSDDTHSLYENKNIVPFGYTYNTYVTEKDFEKANAVQREQTMTQNAVISDTSDIASASLQKSSIANDLTTHDISTNFYYHKTKKKGKLVQIKVPKEYFNDQCYIYLQNVHMIPSNSGRNHILYTGKNNTRFRVGIAGHTSTIFNAEEDSIYEIGNRNYLLEVNTNNIKKDQKYVTLSIIMSRSATYKIGKISVVQINSKKQAAALNALKNNPHLTDISYDGANHFSGNIKTTDDRILCIPFAYSKGWKATDNGKSVKVIKVNGMFCGIVLKSGTHNIKLNYTTPGLKIGACISLISLIILIVISRSRKLSIYKKK
nr:YfhO family protein [uncultured Anaerostipes sp.]